MNKYDVLSLLLLIAGFVMAGFAYGVLPERVATHWDAYGVANGFSDRFLGTFLIPIFTVLIWALLRFVPYLDPLRKNIDKFRDTYSRFIFIMLGFFLYIEAISIAFNLGIMFDFSKAMIPPMAVLFYFAGILMSHSKRNFFIGIRTPWTLSSDKVWDATHQLGGKLFRISGVIIMLTVLLPSPWAIFLLLAAVIASGTVSAVYSYIVFSKQNKR